jgi:hypothetical protein
MTEPPFVEESVTISLTGSEALVLFECLSRHFDDDRTAEALVPLSFLHVAESRVLGWTIFPELERQLVAPFRADYDDVLQRAREEVFAYWGDRAE